MGDGKPLKDPPTTLKEAIDWLVLVGGGFGGKGCGDTGEHDKLEAALKKLPGFYNTAFYNQDFKGDSLSDYIDRYAQALSSGFLGYNGWNSSEFTGNGLIGIDGEYKSTYHNAKWEDNASEYAKIFLFLACLVFYFITFLYWMCHSGGKWANGTITESNVLGQFLTAMGFTPTQLNRNKQGSEIAKHLDGSQGSAGSHELSEACGSGNSVSSYATFLQQLERVGPSKRPEYPLTICKRFSYEYLQSRYSGTDITNAIGAIKEELVNLSERFSSYASVNNDFYALQQKIKTLLGKIHTFDPNAVPSPVAPLAGAVTTLTAAGGAGAAYGLNLFGFQGIVKALFGFKPFSCDSPSNLKEAIDWILRVTGKDGHDSSHGTTAITALTQQVTQLLSEVGKSETKLGSKLDEIKNALGTSGSGNLITNLVKGLQQFIGYEGGMLSDSKTPKTNGGGILPANVAKYQVCNAVLNFVISFLEGLCGIKASGHGEVWKVIGKLRECVGTGQVPQGFGTLVEGIGKKVEKNSGFNGDVGSKLKEMFGKLKGIVTSHENQENVDNLETFLTKVFNGQNSETSSDFKTLCDKLKALFEDGNLKSGMTTANKHLELSQLTSKLTPITNQAQKVNPSRFTNSTAKALSAGVQSAAYAFLAEIKDPSQYTSFYKGVDNKDVNNVQCAKIFLGCLPLYYQALTYISWGCHDNGGGWRNLTLAGGDLKSYFDSQGFLSPYVDRSKRGAHIAGSALKGFQAEFTKGMEGATSVTTFPYASFATKLREKVNGSTSDYTDCPLSALYYGASCYFRYRQIATAKSAGGTPRTIREMLYFLAALQFSSAYDQINEHIGTLLNPSMSVADSSKPASGGNDTLSAADIKEYLTASCAFSSSVLGLIQGPGASQNTSDPWLFELFCNSAFQFKYTSGAILFSTISNYAYALQFQLLFLYQQCSNNGVKCGWQECSYGRNVNKDSSGNSLQSHICPGFKCGGDSRCTRTKGGTNCNHNNYNDQNNSCGKGSNPSPLQAFITGALLSFGLSSSSTPNHMSDHPQGALCHTPMGFEATHLRQDPGTGNYILSALRPICGDVSSPFRQLCEKLGCLTKRTPRTLGDMFGFIWHLNGQLFNTELLKSTLQTSLSSPSTQSIKALLTNSLTPPTGSLLSTSLNTLESGFTFWGTLDGYFAVSDIAVGLYGLNQHCHHQAAQASSIGQPQLYKHTSNCTSANDLQSLLNGTKNDNRTKHEDCLKGSCGPYLSPLTHSAGATYAPVHASVYRSWLAYLTDDFHEWFQNLFDEFKNIDCSKTGCRKPASGNQQACTSHKAGTHGASSGSCTCDSVVHCGGVLPVLYGHGFRYYSPILLMGGSTRSDDSKRSCDKFDDALSNVLAEGAPLTKLLQSIDDFLYLFRFYFFYNQSAFWSIYVCIILYTFFFLLDTLRVRSHLHFPSTNSIAPISLLGAGKAPALKKFTKLTYFMP
ncbi:extracellular matrix-binding ebh [Babesia caballi]|uniref:Extracellular matrix-binding ebh n=1 Tax=Babesia caballi TaxID=5871 RepID=A0AAV4LUW2_BABCB|nr:extracellular matrix-binding ebh [Babesia caballi]